MEGFPSGQRGQTVNLLRDASVVRIHHLPLLFINAGWSSLEARRAHNPKVIGSNPIPATYEIIKNKRPSTSLHYVDVRRFVYTNLLAFVDISSVASKLAHPYINSLAFIHFSNSFAQIAQLVEQRTENPRVTGSIPVLGTELLKFQEFFFGYFQIL